MSEYEALVDTLCEMVGREIVIIDKKGHEKLGMLLDVWDNTVTVEHKPGFPCHYPITGEYDFKVV